MVRRALNGLRTAQISGWALEERIIEYCFDCWHLRYLRYINYNVRILSSSSFTKPLIISQIFTYSTEACFFSLTSHNLFDGNIIFFKTEKS